MTTEHISSEAAEEVKTPSKHQNPRTIYGTGNKGRGMPIEVKSVSFSDVPVEQISSPDFLVPVEVATEAVAWWPDGVVSRPSAPTEPAEEPLSEELAARVEEAAATAVQEGFEAGRKEGLEAAAAEIETRIDEEMSAIHETRKVLEQRLKELAMLRSQLLEQAEADALDLIFSVSKRLAGEAQLTDTSWVGPLVKQASKALTDNDQLVCKVSPELAERLGGADAFQLSHGASLVIDADLEPLDLIVETKTGRVDASFEERLDNLMRAVTADLDAQAREGASS